MLAWIGSVLTLSAVVLGLNWSSDDFLLHWTRYTAHLAFPYLLLAFCASSLHRLVGSDWTASMLRNRRYIGLSFATAHGIHLIALTMFLLADETWRPDTYFFVAAFGFVVTAALAITSNNTMVRRVGAANWRTLHRWGINTLMLYFTVAFSATLLANQEPLSGIYVLLIAVALILKYRARSRVVVLAS